MFQSHSALKNPPNEDVKIWRYLDFPELVDLLDRKAIYFVKASELELFDPYEGKYTDADYEYGEFLAGLNYPVSIQREAMKATEDQIKKVTFLSCWHVNEDESAAMWKVYSLAGQGIAIQSTFKDFKECFSKSEESIYIGLVDYRDYKTHRIRKDNVFPIFFHKRLSFDYEREIRALVMKMPIKEGRSNWDLYDSIKGIHINIDLTALIKKIYISPTTSRWIGDLVKTTLKRFGIDVPVENSELPKRPIR